MSQGEKKREVVSNRKAYHNYEVIDALEAGIELQGTEIKSIRQNGASLQEAYIKIFQGQMWLVGAHIAPYRYGNIHNHEERRDRRLLMHKKELMKLEEKVKEKGFSLIPLSLYFKGGRIKVKVGYAKGKKAHDKRQSIRDKDDQRSMQRALKHNLT